MKKGEKTRQRLLECAANVIAFEGSSNFTIRRLASEAGVSPGLVTRYFPKVDEIYPAVVEYIFAQHSAHVPSAILQMRGEQRLIETAKFSFDFFLFDNLAYDLCLTHAYVYAQKVNSVADLLRGAVWGSIERLKKHARDMLDDRGLSASDRQLTLFATASMQLLEGALMHCTLLKTKREQRQYAETYFEIYRFQIEAFVRSLS